MHLVRILTTDEQDIEFQLPDDYVLQVEVDGRTYVGVTMPTGERPVAVVYWRDEAGVDNVTVEPPGVPDSRDECIDGNGEWLPRGRCDTCGSPCDAITGDCTRDPAHPVALP